MRRHRLPFLIVFIVCLVCPLSFLDAKGPTDPVVGKWELVGLGDDRVELRDVPHILITIDASGLFDYQVWKDDDEARYEISGDWNLLNDMLTMTPHDAEAMKAPVKAYRIAWDGATLLLHDEDDGNRDTPSLRFVRTTTAAR